MTSKLIAPAAFGTFGLVVLLGLGIWQVQRLTWKEAVLDRIDNVIANAPVELPSQPNEAQHQFLAVTAAGTPLPGALKALTSIRGMGPGHRIVVPFEVENRRIMLDLGFLPDGSQLPDLPDSLTVEGNLHWPDDYDRLFTPDPEGDLWFARQVDGMARALNAEALLLVARNIVPSPDGLLQLPVDSSGIPNNHFQYAVTWFGLAAAWLAMTVYWMWKIAGPPGVRARRSVG
ncbi:MAG: SURF1 family protein [Rhodobacteraceae bacterium]|nr:SURF1 family protein [Paracoccaceae bacterium]